jgi:hypothetical protein
MTGARDGNEKRCMEMNDSSLLATHMSRHGVSGVACTNKYM